MTTARAHRELSEARDALFLGSIVKMGLHAQLHWHEQRHGTRAEQEADEAAFQSESDRLDAMTPEEQDDLFRAAGFEPGGDEEWVKQAAAPKHVFITGVSGAGKTTLAKQMSKDLGLDLISLDGIAAKGDRPWSNTDDAREFIKEHLGDKPYLIEGAQVLGFKPKELKGHRVVLVEQPKSVVVDRLVSRGWSDAKGKHFKGEGARRDAEVFHDWLAEVATGFKREVNPEVVTPAFRKQAAAQTLRPMEQGDIKDFKLRRCSMMKEEVRADLEDMGFDSRRIASEGAARIARLLEGQRLMADSFDYLFDEIMEWKRATFPAETQASALAHFMAEASELEACPSDGEEIADCVMLLLSLAAHAGVSLKDEMRAKLEKNRRRKWGEPNADGFQEHVRTLGDEP